MVQEKIQLPQPTGPYRVGVTAHFLKDVSRYYNNQKGRPLLVRIYYPSVGTQKAYPPYLNDTMHLYKERILNTYNVLLKDLEYLDEIKDWAMPDASINGESAPFPVLFFLSYAFLINKKVRSP